MEVTQPADAAELRTALAVLVATPNLLPTEIDYQIDLLLRYAEKKQLSLEHCLILKDQWRIVATCLCVDSPGRTASVFIPQLAADDKVAGAAVELLIAASPLAQERNIQLLQAMVRPEAVHDAKAYRLGGFEHLTQLIYLERDLAQPVLLARPQPTVTWETYSSEEHDLFARAVRGTYEGSLDCGSLNGLRDIEDILASHRAAGEFDPRCWLVARFNSQPVGVILLGYTPERSSYEVVYMGVLPAWRGRGYGSALLKRGVEMARNQGAITLTLAVDVRNWPGQKLYAAFGFREVARRDAWIKILSRPGVAPGRAAR